MASGAAMIRVDSGAKNALQTLLQHALDVAKSDSVDSLITHLPKILPDAGKSSLSSVIHSLLRHAGYSWDSNRVWLTASPHEKSERRATAGPTTSRATAPRVAMGNWRPLRMCRLIGAHWACIHPCPTTYSRVLVQRRQRASTAKESSRWCWAVGACSPLLLTLDNLHFGRA